MTKKNKHKHIESKQSFKEQYEALAYMCSHPKLFVLAWLTINKAFYNDKGSLELSDGRNGIDLPSHAYHDWVWFTTKWNSKFKKYLLNHNSLETLEIYFRELQKVKKAQRQYAKCKVNKCSVNATSRGLCYRHYSRHRQGTLVLDKDGNDELVNKKKNIGIYKQCKVMGCTTNAVTLEMCKPHYSKHRRGTLRLDENNNELPYIPKKADRKILDPY